MSDVWLPARRALRGAVNPTIDWQPVDQDGEPANLGDSSGDVTVSVSRSDGTAVAGVGAVTGFGEQTPRLATLPADAVAAVDWLDVAWSHNGTVLHTEVLEVVGGTIGTHADIVNDTNLAVDAARPLVLQARRAIEDIATRVMHRSPVPRFFREKLSGCGTSSVAVTWPNVTEVVWGRWWNGSTWTDFTAAEVAAMTGDDAGIVHWRDGVFPHGVRNIELGYRHGWTSIPNDLLVELRRAVAHKASQLMTDSTPMDRATSMSTFDGMNITLATPGVRGWSTGLPDCDEKLNGYRFEMFGVA